MAFQHKLKALRENRGLSMEELVNELYKRYSLTINKSTVSRWENGAEPKGKDLHYLAHFFNVSPAELIDLDIQNNKENLISQFNLDTFSFTFLPRYGSIAAGALATVEGVTTESVEYLAMPKEFLGKYSNCSSLFAMVVNGDSMNKIIANESIVIAKSIELNQYNTGDIVIFSYNNEFSLKRYAPDELDGYILFKSESTDPSFKDIPIPIDSTDELKLFGKVIYYSTTL